MQAIDESASPDIDPEQAAFAFIYKRSKLNHKKLSDEEKKCLKKIGQRSYLLENQNPQKEETENDKRKFRRRIATFCEDTILSYAIYIFAVGYAFAFLKKNTTARFAIPTTIAYFWQLSVYNRLKGQEIRFFDVVLYLLLNLPIICMMVYFRYFNVSLLLSGTLFFSRAPDEQQVYHQMVEKSIERNNNKSGVSEEIRLRLPQHSIIALFLNGFKQIFLDTFRGFGNFPRIQTGSRFPRVWTHSLFSRLVSGIPDNHFLFLHYYHSKKPSNHPQNIVSKYFSSRNDS